MPNAAGPMGSVHSHTHLQYYDRRPVRAGARHGDGDVHERPGKPASDEPADAAEAGAEAAV